ncbi:hypothetical protein [Cellulomonas sp. URHB0016]
MTLPPPGIPFVDIGYSPSSDPTVLTNVLAGVSALAIFFFVAVCIGAGPTSRKGYSPYPLFLIALVAMVLAISSTYVSFRIHETSYERAMEAHETLERTTTERVLGQLQDAYGVTFLDDHQRLPHRADSELLADLRLPDGTEQTCAIGSFDDVFALRCGDAYWEDQTPLPIVEGWTGPGE